MLTKQDYTLLKKKGISERQIQEQNEAFRKGFPFVRLDRPATPGDGIVQLESKKAQDLARYYDENKDQYRLVKFVPASGAATRMFKHLHSFMAAGHTPSEMEKVLARDKGPESVHAVLRNLSSFAFFDDLSKALQQDGKEVRQLIDKNEYNTILEYLLGEKGLQYAALPKALLRFHRYISYSRTALEEHLVEGAHYVKQADSKVNLHFTISPEHEDSFRKRLEKAVPVLEERYGVSFSISLSNQKPSTDTLAVDMENEPFRDKAGHLLFRPGGHGALIENLNDLEEDIVFIKNIDNVVPDRLKQETYLYKKVLGGFLLRIRQQVNEYLSALEYGSAQEPQFSDMVRFIEQELGGKVHKDFDALALEEKKRILFQKLHRPIRVCGMVKNVGEPGGGPFWVQDRDGDISLQIVESSQMDLNDAEQKMIMQQATHFNPVDLACSLTDHKGEPYDLRKFVDPETGFISIKSHGGTQIKALELPGLWNGAMAHWNTIFIEVPIITFNPVKTINDLLRKEHQ